MNRDNIDEILESLELLNPRKAKKLRELLRQEFNAEGKRKDEYSQKIWNYLYHLFLSCLSKESRNNLINTSISINENCYLLGQESQDGWVIYHTGAMRVQRENGHAEIVGEIPREYGKGFYLEERHPQTEEERINAEKEIDFYSNYCCHLAVISSEMDYKEAYLANGYQIKDPRIPKEFVELLINTLGLARVKPEMNLTDTNQSNR